MLCYILLCYNPIYIYISYFYVNLLKGMGHLSHMMENPYPHFAASYVGS